MLVSSGDNLDDNSLFQFIKVPLDKVIPLFVISLIKRTTPSVELYKLFNNPLKSFLYSIIIVNIGM